MSQTYREASRLDWHRTDDEPLTLQELTLGTLQRIANATELMAKRHEELITAKERAERGATAWKDACDRRDRRLIAARGRITKLKNELASARQGATS